MLSRQSCALSPRPSRCLATTSLVTQRHHMCVASWHNSSRYDGVSERCVVAPDTLELLNGGKHSCVRARFVIYVVAWQVLLSSSIAFVGLTMAWRVAENEFTAREEFAGRASHKNPMRDSNLSSGSTSPDSPTPRHSPSIDNFRNDGSENNRTEALESNVDRTAKQDGAQSGRTAKLRLSMTWSGQSPRSRKSSDLEQSLTPRSRE